MKPRNNAKGLVLERLPERDEVNIGRRVFSLEDDHKFETIDLGLLESEELLGRLVMVFNGQLEINLIYDGLVRENRDELFAQIAGMIDEASKILSQQKS